MKKFIDFFIFSNIYISVCAAFLCLFSFEILGLSEDKSSIALFIFFSTLCAYNFQRLRGIDQVKILNQRTSWMKKHYKFSLAFSIVSLLIAISLYFLLPNSIIILLMPLTLICLWYAVGLMGQGKFDRPLREVPFLKIFLIAFVWTGACLMFPAVSFHGFSILSDLELQLMAIAYGCFIFSLTLPFDIRDLKDDKSLAILTIPGTIGIFKTKLLSAIGFLISILLFLLFFCTGKIDLVPMIAFIASCMLSMVLVSFSSPYKSEYYFSVLLESPLLFPFILLQLFRLFL